MTASDNYKQQLKMLHGSKTWGSSSTIPKMAEWSIEEYKVSSIVDFGCGKGNVTKALRKAYPNLDVIGYDPVDDSTELPDKTDMIFSKDVLEHIEPHMLEYVISDLWKRTQKVQYHLIACHKAIHFMPDGRNAHLIVETPDWWQRFFRSMGFKIVSEEVTCEIKQPRARESLATTKYQCVIEMM